MRGKILVTGAAGTVGRHTVRHLSSMNINFRAAVHTHSDIQNVSFQGVEPVVMDFNDKESIWNAFQGIDNVFLITPFNPYMVEQVENCLEVAVESGVSYIVRLSTLRAEIRPGVMLTQLHQRAEDLIEGAGIDFVHLRPNEFMQDFLSQADSIRDNNQFYASGGTGKVSYIDVRDIASVASRLLIERGHENSAYNLTGPEALDLYDVAEVFSGVLEKDITYNEVSTEHTRQWMNERDYPDWVIDLKLEWSELQKQGYLSEITMVTERIANKPPIYFEQFVRDYAEHFQKEKVSAHR
jgi:uncharacterized protein YbjT (DUF2867 family)